MGDLLELQAVPGQPEAAPSNAVTRVSSEKETTRRTPTPTEKASESNSAMEESEVLSELRWENKLLEKRYKRLSKSSEDLQHDAMRHRLQSRRGDAPAPPPPAATNGARCSTPMDLNKLLADNEARLQALRQEVGTIPS